MQNFVRKQIGAVFTSSACRYFSSFHSPRVTMSEALSPAVSCLKGHRTFSVDSDDTHEEGRTSASVTNINNHLAVPAGKVKPSTVAETPPATQTSGKDGFRRCVMCSVDCSPLRDEEYQAENTNTNSTRLDETDNLEPKLLYVPNQDNFSSESFIVALPRGAYTTARSFGGPHRVLEFDMHVERLVSSLCLMQQSIIAAVRKEDDSSHFRQQQIPQHCTVPDVSQVKSGCIKLLRFGLPHLKSAFADFGSLEEARITFLLHFGGPTDLNDPTTVHTNCPESGKCTLVMYLERMAPLPAPPIKVQVRGKPRHNAEAKDSQWVVDRQSLAKSATQGVNEVLLVEGSLIEEGLSSNFFAVEEDGSITTADSGVLKGTIRSIAIAQAQSHGVDVNLRPPNLRDASRWQSAFLTSTSRMVLPVDELEVFAQPTDSEPVECYKFTNHGVTEKLREWAAAGAAQHVTDINEVSE